jgi:hypothetical protein
MKTKRISTKRFLLNIFRLIASGNLYVFYVGEYNTCDTNCNFTDIALMHFDKRAYITKGAFEPNKHYFYSHTHFVAETIGIEPDVQIRINKEEIVDFFQLDI